MDWVSVELDYAEQPRERVLSLVGRAVSRVLPRMAVCVPDYGQEVWEWYRLLHGLVATIQTSHTQQPLSRFSWDLCAELARATATIAATRAQRVGPSSRHEELERVIAAVAFWLDGARAKSAERRAELMATALRNALLSADLTDAYEADALMGGPLELQPEIPLWPQAQGGPQWYRLACLQYADLNWPAWQLPTSPAAAENPQASVKEQPSRLG